MRRKPWFVNLEWMTLCCLLLGAVALGFICWELSAIFLLQNVCFCEPNPVILTFEIALFAVLTGFASIVCVLHLRKVWRADIIE